MSDFVDHWRSCITCGNYFDTSDWARYSPGAMECRECARGLVPDRRPNAEEPSHEYLAELARTRRESGLCEKCETPLNGDRPVNGLCQACVVAGELVSA